MDKRSPAKRKHKYLFSSLAQFLALVDSTIVRVEVDVEADSVTVIVCVINALDPKV